MRKEVFVAGHGVPEDLEYDEYDAGALHVLTVREDGAALGTARFLYGEAAPGGPGVTRPWGRWRARGAEGRARAARRGRRWSGGSRVRPGSWGSAR